MNAREASALGKQIATLVQSEQPDEAYDLLAPVLAKRTPFRLLGRIGEAIGAGPLPEACPEYDRRVNAFLGQIAAAKTEGGWVVIGSALGRQLDRDPAGAFARCRAFVIAADVWYGADILGERVPGPALVADFQPSLALLAPWREDVDRWLRRKEGLLIVFGGKTLYRRVIGIMQPSSQIEGLALSKTP